MTRPDDSKAGWKAVTSFLRTLGSAFELPDLSPQMKQKSLKTFENFIAKFKTILGDPKSLTKDVSLAVQGYSAMASACKLHRTASDVAKMLSELVSKTEDVFVTNANQKGPTSTASSGKPKESQSELTHFPNYVDAIATVLRQVWSRNLVPVGTLSLFYIPSCKFLNCLERSTLSIIFSMFGLQLQGEKVLTSRQNEPKFPNRRFKTISIHDNGFQNESK